MSNDTLIKRLRKDLTEHPAKLIIIALLLSAISLVGQGCCLKNLPSVITELQFAGNWDTAIRVLYFWNAAGINLPRVEAAIGLDFFLIVGYVILLVAAVCAAAPHFLDGARKWKPYFALAVFLAGIFNAFQDGALLVLLWGWADTTGVVFFCATVKTFFFSAAVLYVAAGFSLAEWTRGFWDAVRVCGFSLFAALVGPGLLSFDNQGAAIFDASVDEPGRPQCAYAAAFIFSMMCWGAARYAVSYKEEETRAASINPTGLLSRIWEKILAPVIKSWAWFFAPLKKLFPSPQEPPSGRTPSLPGQNDREKKKGWEAGSDWVPRFCGVAPPLLIALNIALTDGGDLTRKSSGWWMVAIAVVMAVWMGVHYFFRKSYKVVLARLDTNFYHLISFAGAVAVLCVSLTPCYLQFLTRGGPLAAWFLSFSLMVPWFTFLIWTGRRHRKPYLALFLAYGFLVNVANLNDDHEMRHIYNTALLPDNQQPPRLNDAFDKWLTETGAKGTLAKPYPVVFVAAAGGGIVAGSALTATMAELGVSVPHAEEHLFAISGVSGGSLGAVTYALRRGPHFHRDAETVMTSDMLSPTVASLFGPEMVQRFLPFAVPDWLGYDKDYGAKFDTEFAMDRGRALDLAFENALKSTNKSTKDQSPMLLSRYPPPGPNDPPALFLNSTCVETGQRMVISTLRPDPADPKLKKGDWPLPFETLYDTDPHVDLPLSTAACLSARFPIVSPPAFLSQWRELPIRGLDPSDPHTLTVKRRYVDGGYYENSGVETAMDVIDALHRQDKLRNRTPWRAVLISIHPASDDHDDTSLQTARGGIIPTEQGTRASTPRRSSGFDEIVGPVDAFFNGWGGPARPQFMRARRRLPYHAEKGPDSDFIEMPFPKPHILSWYLSKNQYETVQSQATALLCGEMRGGKWVTGKQGQRLRAILMEKRG